MRSDTQRRKLRRQAGTVLLFGLAASLAHAAPPRWSVPRDARIEHLEAGMQKGFEDNYMKEHCGDFTLTAEETLTYLRSATTITEQEVHDRVDWLPCVVRGTLVSGKGTQRKEVPFEISATLAAHVFEPGKPLAYLFCEGACEAKMNAIIEKHLRQEQK
ncbi:hypothetical protein [Corallococcus exercitus]|uniref:Uncharacterized protein n=1 Tax=Corallococcus exercitus TaxID=2316736 RepID=A0A7Y4NFW4_9BACT|nr:hypothetical protein [Corallococcus exercitus]NOK12807.1 hypothetical protein [Corallococcus exercitus]